MQSLPAPVAVELRLTFFFLESYHRPVGLKRLPYAPLIIVALVSILFGVLADASSAQTPDDYQTQIESALAAGRLDAAEALARQATRAYPHSAEAYQLLGVVLFKKQSKDEARQAFQRSIELDSRLPDTYYDMALLELSENKYSEAVKPLETFVRLEPSQAEAHLLLGRAYHNLNRTMPAIAEFKKALELSPRLPLGHYHLGVAYQSQGKLTAALEEYRQEMELNPGFPESYWLAGNIELDRGESTTAEPLFRKAIALKPQAIPAHYGLARVLVAQNRLDAAETELKAVLAADSNDVQAHYTLARLYQRMGRAEDAVREYQVVQALHARSQADAPRESER